MPQAWDYSARNPDACSCLTLLHLVSSFYSLSCHIMLTLPLSFASLVC